MTARFNVAIGELQNRFGAALSTNLTIRQQHAHTMTWLDNEPADAVLTVASKEDVPMRSRFATLMACPSLPLGWVHH